MLIQPRTLGYAAGITAAIVSTVCALFLAITPSTATALLGLAIHQDLNALTRR